MTFDEGDVVSRKTGGPMMTVEKIRSDDLLATVWFDVDGRVQRDAFAPNTLLKWQLVSEEK